MRLRTPARTLVVVALLIAVISVVTWLILRSQGSAGAGDRTPAPTLLIQVLDDAGEAVGTVVVSGGPPPAAIVVPRTLLIPTPEPIPLALAPAEPDTLAARDGVSALLGVRIDASLVIDRLALAALIDAAGGAPLQVRERIVERSSDGTELLAIAPGARVLDGRSAAAYATVAQPGESITEADRRLVEVLGRVLTGLPDDEEELRQVLLSLGTSASASKGIDALVSTVLDVREGIVSVGLTPTRLPVVTLVDGVSSVIRQPEATAVVRALLPTALLRAGESPLPRVRVDRAGASVTEVTEARALLAEQDTAVVSVVTTAPQASAVVIPVDGSRELGERIAIALGIPVSAVREAELQVAPELDAVVILGPGIPRPSEGTGIG